MICTKDGVCIFTVEEFKEACCNQGCFVDDDGSGYYSNDLKQSSNLLALPSDFMKGKIDTKWTYVFWYNK